MDLWMPEADRSITFDLDGGSMIGGPPRGVIHTTETLSMPSYLKKGSDGVFRPDAPHFTVTRDGKIFQHYPINRACRALRNYAGGVQTNRDGDFCIQIEVVGYARQTTWPEVQINAVLRVMAFAKQQAGIPMALPLEFGNGSEYGFFNPLELTNDEWVHFTGWCGHQHVPENTHWDPGKGLPDAIKRKLEVHPMAETVGPQFEPGAAKGIDPDLASAWDWAKVNGVFTDFTDPDKQMTNEEFAAFVNRYHTKVVEPALNAIRAKSLPAHTHDVSSVVKVGGVRPA